jgi:signal transduction histidine kinase
MRERSWFFFVLELCMASFCLPFDSGSVGAVNGFEFAEQSVAMLVVTVLVLSCVLTAKLLAGLLRAPSGLFCACVVVAAVAAFMVKPDAFLPLVVVLASDLGSRRRDDHFAFVVVFVGAYLLARVFPQTPAALLGAAAGIALAFAGTVILRLLARAQSELVVLAERATASEARLEAQRAAIGTIEQQGRVAERNRLAARIHDQVGHGMTGSILMLEAAQVQLEQDPRIARKSIEVATENLRESVEEIRRELREERVASEPVGLGRIAAEVEGFATEHPAVHTELVTEGSLERVPQAVWLCVFESLRETLTNLLRHSDADHFRVNISQRNRLLIAEFCDNGRTAHAHEPTGEGIGLAAIEERTLLSGGRAFFSLTPHGFSTRLVFTLRG